MSDNVVQLATVTDTRLKLAEALEAVAQQIRAGDAIADQAMLICRNTIDGRMHVPLLMGKDATAIEILGMLAYGSHHYYEREIQDA